MHVPAGGSIYERWVNTLRAWSRDPEGVSLQELPALRDDTFTPETYRRLIDHILEAMRLANERWHQGLVRAWGTSSTPFELAREFVSLRTTLARRLQLAHHPGLPEPIRKVLFEGLRADVERYQREAEEMVSKSSAGASLDTTWRNQMLAVVREHSFIAVLSYDVSGDRPQAAPLPERAQTGSVAPSRPSVRRVVPFTASPEVPRG